jgi:hypothetical protein
VRTVIFSEGTTYYVLFGEMVYITQQIVTKIVRDVSEKIATVFLGFIWEPLFLKQEYSFLSETEL